MAKTLKKDASQWSNVDLQQWAKDEIVTAQPLTDRQVADEVIRRRNLEGEYSVEDIKGLLLGNKPAPKESEEPAPTETEEKTPEAKPAATTPEVKPKQPVVEGSRREATVKARQEAAPAPKLTQGGDEATLSLEIIQQNMEEYARAMKPGRAHSGTEGPLNQVKLYRTVQMVLRQKGANFHRAYGYLLEFVHNHRQGVFNEMYVYRYFDSRQMKTSLPAGERRKFERVLNLLLTTANPLLRSKALEHVDIDATMESFKDPEMHQRVLGFYQGL